MPGRALARPASSHSAAEIAENALARQAPSESDRRGRSERSPRGRSERSRSTGAERQQCIGEAVATENVQKPEEKHDSLTRFT